VDWESGMLAQGVGPADFRVDFIQRNSLAPSRGPLGVVCRRDEVCGGIAPPPDG